MAKKISSAEFQALAELRYRIRLFLREGDAAARLAGLEPQQYLMLLAIRGLAAETPPKIQIFADRLALRHHSAVELVDRLEQRGYVPNDFKVENGSFTNPIKFWAQLGVAMQQMELRSLMLNLPSFFTGTPFLPSAYV